MKQVTLAIIKPDAVKGGHVGEILAAAARVGLQPIAIQMHRANADAWSNFYYEHRGKPFFDELCAFMASGPCVFVAFEGGLDAIQDWRDLMGATDPKKAEPGTLRGIYGTAGPANAVHGSADPVAAERELMFVDTWLRWAR